MSQDKQESLEALQNLEANAKNNKDTSRDYLGDYKLPEAIDGYRIVEREKLPFGGRLYPNSWNFAYRCPTSKEVANFSTIDEQNPSAIQTTVTDLIKKCFVIVDSETQNQISTEEINDGDKLFFFLLLREFYLHDKPIQYSVMNVAYNEPVIVNLSASMLVYPELKEKLYSCYDGRMFTIPTSNPEKPIKFLIPTFKTATRIFKYMVKTYQELQKDENSKKTVEEFDKQFLMFAPFLYEHGTETIETLKLKFRQVQTDDKYFKDFLTVINSIKLSNLDKIIYTYLESEEEALVKFPGGWKSMFIDNTTFEDLF